MIYKLEFMDEDGEWKLDPEDGAPYSRNMCDDLEGLLTIARQRSYHGVFGSHFWRVVDEDGITYDP